MLPLQKDQPLSLVYNVSSTTNISFYPKITLLGKIVITKAPIDCIYCCLNHRHIKTWGADKWSQFTPNCSADTLDKSTANVLIAAMKYTALFSHAGVTSTSEQLP